MTVEDLLERIADHLMVGASLSFNPLSWHPMGTRRVGDWNTNFVQNVHAYVQNGHPLSTEQARIVLRLGVRYEADLIGAKLLEPGMVASLVAAPVYRRPPYQSANVPREVRYLGGNLLGFRFKFNDMIRDDIKKLKGRDTPFDDAPYWFYPDHKLWVVAVTRATLNGVQDIIAHHRFSFDDEVVRFLADCTNVEGLGTVVQMDDTAMAAVVCDDEYIGWWMANVINGEAV